MFINYSMQVAKFAFKAIKENKTMAKIQIVKMYKSRQQEENLKEKAEALKDSNELPTTSSTIADMF